MVYIKQLRYSTGILAFALLLAATGCNSAPPTPSAPQPETPARELPPEPEPATPAEPVAEPEPLVDHSADKAARDAEIAEAREEAVEADAEAGAQADEQAEQNSALAEAKANAEAAKSAAETELAQNAAKAQWKDAIGPYSAALASEKSKAAAEAIASFKEAGEKFYAARDAAAQRRLQATAALAAAEAKLAESDEIAAVFSSESGGAEQSEVTVTGEAAN
jgi:hypothetical protein